MKKTTPLSLMQNKNFSLRELVLRLFHSNVKEGQRYCCWVMLSAVKFNTSSCFPKDLTQCCFADGILWLDL